MKTKYFILAAIAGMTFASCSNDEYIGDTSPDALTSQGTDGAIVLSGNAGNFTRATSNTGTVANMLDNHFKFYGVKNVSGYTDVFKNYAAWASTTKTTSNPDGADADADNKSRMNGWEYVGNGSTYGGQNPQYVKYWDYSATDYHFVAGSPHTSFTYNTAVGGDIASATVTGVKGHISINHGTPGTTNYNPVYIADPVKVVKDDFNKEVVFSFTRQQTLVRVGIYETIPGYSITDIKFYPWNTDGGGSWGTPTNNITLASKTANYFQGSANATATVTYNWTTPGYTFAYASGLTQSNNWYGGQLVLSSSNKLATSSTDASKDYFYGTDQDMADATRYFTVLPSPSALEARPILIKCDYVLTAEGNSGETIKVSGATAAIPANFCKWKQNTSYTYLFKISDNTNGTTGTPGTDDPEGLFPITFDAVVIAEADAMKEGYITTVSTPSITTYQAGSVTANGVEYKTGTAIYFTAQNDETGVLNTLSALNNESPAVGMVKVYSVAAGTTEADLILTRPTTTATTTIGDAAWNINGQSVAVNQWASFTPTVAGTYAIEYITSVTAGVPTYAYKVVKVE